MHGMLCQCLDTLEKQSRGIQTLRGKPQSCSSTKNSLLQEATLSLAMCGGNKLLAQSLAQKLSPPTIRLDELDQHSLPCPALALLRGHEAQLERNMILVDQRWPRTEDMSSRRCVLGLDATYLLKYCSQLKFFEKVGVIGGCWSASDETEAFVPAAEADPRSMLKAPVIYEFVVWNPCEASPSSSYSVASMPMALKAPKHDSGETLVHAGNLAP